MTLDQDLRAILDAHPEEKKQVLDDILRVLKAEAEKYRQLQLEATVAAERMQLMYKREGIGRAIALVEDLRRTT